MFFDRVMDNVTWSTVENKTDASKNISIYLFNMSVVPFVDNFKTGIYSPGKSISRDVLFFHNFFEHNFYLPTFIYYIKSKFLTNPRFIVTIYVVTIKYSENGEVKKNFISNLAVL